MSLHDSTADDLSRIELTRDELLTEMGLGPVWHLRGAEAEPELVAAATPAQAVTPAPAMARTVEPSNAPLAQTVPEVAATPLPSAPRKSAADVVAAARALLNKGQGSAAAPVASARPAVPPPAAAAFTEPSECGVWDDDLPPLSAYAEGFIADSDEREPLPPDDLEPVADTDLSPEARRASEIAELGWEALEERIRACQDCALCQQRKQAVPGVGDRRPDWLFIGEGPGADEDAQGEPFVGQAGKLLDAMLAAIDLQRGNKVYIANAVKCRPPGNRTPAAEEIATCWPYLQRQIALLQPKLIVLLGRPAVAAVLGGEASIASLRGKRLDYQGTPVLVSYHPAYLLRNLPDKAKAWEDLCRARAWMRELQSR